MEDGTKVVWFENDLADVPEYLTPRQRKESKQIVSLHVTAAQVRKVRRETKAKDKQKILEQDVLPGSLTKDVATPNGQA